MWNVTNGTSKVLYSYYGIPKYQDIKACCYAEFHIHIYVCALGHIVVYVYGMSLIVNFIKTLLRQRIALLVLISIIVTEINNIIFILTDPYGLLERLPKPVLVILWKFNEVAILWVFCLVNYFVSQKTRLNMFMFDTRNKIVVLIVLKSVTVVGLEIISCENLTEFPLYILNDSAVALWVFCYITIFIFNVPKLSKYIRETKKAKQSFTEFNHFRKDNSFKNVDSAQKRLIFPKIRLSSTSNSLRKISLINISDSSLQDIHYCPKSSSPKRPNLLRVKPVYTNPSTESDDSDCESDQETDGKRLFESTTQALIKTAGQNGKDTSLPCFITDCCATENTDLKSDNEKWELRHDDDNDQANQVQMLNEQGYLADNEDTIPNNAEYSENRKYSKKEFVRMTTSVFPASESFLSLYRMKHYTMLRGTLNLCYILVTILGLMIICKVYIVFSAYGGIFQSNRMRPVDWIIFQSVYRLIETAVSAVYVGVAHVVCSSTSKHFRKRHS